jgi:hypothetical protein
MQKGANDAFPGPANDGSPGPRNSERQITAAAVTQGAVDFVYGASLRVFLIPNAGAITKVSGDYKDNLALNTKWMLSSFALGALPVQPSKRFATSRTITKPLAVSSGVVSPETVATCCEMLLDMLENLTTRELECLREHILFIIASDWPMVIRKVGAKSFTREATHGRHLNPLRREDFVAYLKVEWELMSSCVSSNYFMCAQSTLEEFLGSNLTPPLSPPLTPPLSPPPLSLSPPPLALLQPLALPLTLLVDNT